MREIKFRAWNGERLRDVWGLGWIDGELDYVNTPKFNGPVDEDVVIMQYTGVKVNRDVELYEGDIVPMKVSVYLGWKQGRYEYKRNAVVKYCEEDMRYKFFANTPYGLQSVEFDKSIRQSYKVIGNIYENPELLEGEED